MTGQTSFQLARVRGFSNRNLIGNEVAYNGKLYFTAAPDSDSQIYADGQTHKAVIWETDGTEEGTKILYDFAPGENSFVPSHLRVANGHLFFEIRIDEGAGSSRYELWSYKVDNQDSSEGVLTRLVYSLEGRFPDSRFDDNVEATKNGLFFLQKDEDGLNELWFTNGNSGPENTYSLGGNEPGKPLSSFVRLIGADNFLYFIADGMESIPGRDEPVYDPNELWSTTPAPGTFKKLSDFDFTQIGSFASPISYEVAIGDSLYFTGRTKFDVGYNYDLEPWVSHGTFQTTQEIANLNPDWYTDNTPYGTASGHFTSFKGEIYFLGINNYGRNEDSSETLYAYNPVSGDVREVAQTAEDWRNHFYRELFVFNEHLYFSGQTEETGWELWRSDGTPNGTGLFMDVKDNGSTSSHPQQFAIHKKDRTLFSESDDDLYFRTEYGRLWRLNSSTDAIEELEVDNSGGIGGIYSVDVENGASDLYFTTFYHSIFNLSEPQPEPGPNDGIIVSIRGKGKLRGTNVADAFTFDTFDFFTKKTADKVIGFDASQGDTIAVSSSAFPALQGASEINFASTRKKKRLKKLSKKDYDFVYFEKKGWLCFDGNGSDKNWGNSDEGGLVAILKGKPELSVEDFTLLA